MDLVYLVSLFHLIVLIYVKYLLKYEGAFKQNLGLPEMLLLSTTAHKASSVTHN